MSSKNQCHKKTILKKNNVINETNLQKKHNVIPPQIRIKWNLNLIIPIGFSTILKSKTIEKPMVFQHFDHAHTRKKKPNALFPMVLQRFSNQKPLKNQWFFNMLVMRTHEKRKPPAHTIRGFFFRVCARAHTKKKKHAHTRKKKTHRSHE